MNGLIYGGVRAPPATPFPTAQRPKIRRFFVLFVNALMESRRHQPTRVIADRVHLLANDPNLPVR
jgi:hypothetical protein